MKRQLVPFLLIFLAAFTACKSTDIRNSLDEIDRYVDADPQAALAAIDGLDMSGIRAESVKAHYSLLHSKALDKCFIDTTDVSVIMDAVNYYSKHGDPDQKMQTYYYLGRIHGNAGRYTESLLALTQALEEGEPSSDVKYKGRVYIAMADAYNRNYNVVEEGRCVDEALRYFEASGDSVQIRAATYRKAISCLNLRDYEQSDSLFQTLLSIPDLRPSLRAKCFVKYAYLLALTDNPDYQKTYSLFQNAIASQAEFSERNLAAYAYILWCISDSDASEDIYRALEQRDSSLVGITSAWKGRIKEKQGRYREAYNYLKKEMKFQSEGVDDALRQSLSVAQRDYFSALAAQQKEQADSHKKISILIGITAIDIILLLILVGVNVIRRNKERNIQAISNLEYIKEKMMTVQKTSEEKENKITALQAKYLEVFQEHFKILANIYETYDMNLVRGDNGITAYKHIQDIFKAIRGEEESEHRFEKIIDRDMDGLISSFRKDYPDLNELDYLLFCYYVAGYDTKTISIILSDKTPSSLYTSKSRLKSKIEASDVKEKEKYLQYF